MRERLWTELGLPLCVKHPTRWVADEDIFQLPLNHVEAFLNVVARCEITRSGHSFRIWSKSAEDQQRVLNHFRQKYQETAASPGAVMLFDFPPPTAQFEIWGDRTLFPAMTVERKGWLQALKVGSIVRVTTRIEAAVEEISSETIALTRASANYLGISQRCLLPRSVGFRRYWNTDWQMWVENWVEPEGG